MLFAMRVTHVTPRVLLIHGNQLSQHLRNYKCQKLGKRMEGETEDLTVPGLEDREIDLISRKV